jgi:plasmid maintenance system antidote protein VapI
VALVNLPLKIAILRSGLKQRYIAERAGIEENRFTKIITGRSKIGEQEKAKVAQIKKGAACDR